ncbi:unnamed protein product [Rangifer tarandus platyrhynchus]|uniref:Uncharacterized protein n=1 Tax=Rangifer tarandus platyrhynchus TaxID=3082113 RepID=A0ABN8ZNH2_RANTA|nr:unnamed protein product [Rangifer tarandus platyrhynchus]
MSARRHLVLSTRPPGRALPEKGEPDALSTLGPAQAPCRARPPTARPESGAAPEQLVLSLAATRGCPWPGVTGPTPHLPCSPLYLALSPGSRPGSAPNSRAVYCPRRSPRTAGLSKPEQAAALGPPRPHPGAPGRDHKGGAAAMVDRALHVAMAPAGRRPSPGRRGPRVSKEQRAGGAEGRGAGRPQEAGPRLSQAQAYRDVGPIGT